MTLGAGLALALLLLLLQAATLVFWQETADVQECRSSALTRTGLQQCQEQYQQGLQDFLPSLPAATPAG